MILASKGYTAMTTEPTDVKGIVFWDMAGTLLSRDHSTGKIRSLPGSGEALSHLSRHYTLCLTTSDITEHARDLLQDVELLQYFSGIYGNFAERVGKPYGTAAMARGVAPENCLAIGDYLRSDVPADSDRLVTVLINQQDFTLHAGMIVALTELLEAHGENPYLAFCNLLEKATPVPDSEPPCWHRTDDFDYYLTWYRHGALEGSRPVIILPG
jgi:hypothetical protein